MTRPLDNCLLKLPMIALATTALVGVPPAAHAQEDPNGLFNHVGTFDVTQNGSEVAEIVAATHGGGHLVYTDSALDSIGFVNILDPENPVGEGTVPVGGSPTSVTLLGRLVLVCVDTSVDFANPSGNLVVVNFVSRAIVATIPLDGQPDSIRLSPDHRFAAIVLENQRDEEFNDGLIPQRPAGELLIVDLVGPPASWTLRRVNLARLSDLAGVDPEPEFVDINRLNQAIVTLQENNHLALVDLVSGTVLGDFSAGEVDLTNVDSVEDALGPQERGLIQLTDTITRRREPDSVVWLNNNVFATANEGDYEDADGVEGGSRSFTLWRKNGTVLLESAEAYEHEAVRIGHYPEDRSENKGVEPESAATGLFGGRRLLFIGAERANVVGIYQMIGDELVQVQFLPTGIGPEGIAPIANRSLLAVANETAEEGYPSMITLYRAEEGPAAYPQIESADDDAGLPLPWEALSGLAGDSGDAGLLYTVSDSWLAEGFIYSIDVTAAPALIFDRTQVTGLSFAPDFEGIATAPEGGFWLASEGRIDARPNAIVHVDDTGVVLTEIELPDTLAALMTDSGLEGIAVTGDSSTEFVYVVIQREWADDQIGQVKIARYDVAAAEWGFVAYALDAVESPNGGWVGLSEITLLPDGTFAIIERDNQIGSNARIKRLYGVDLSTVTFRPHGEDLDVVSKTLLADLLDDLEANSVWTAEKLEGLGVGGDGQIYAVTDNDGLDGAIGQTLFLRLGIASEALVP